MENGLRQCPGQPEPVRQANCRRFCGSRIDREAKTAQAASLPREEAPWETANCSKWCFVWYLLSFYAGWAFFVIRVDLFSGLDHPLVKRDRRISKKFGGCLIGFSLVWLIFMLCIIASA